MPRFWLVLALIAVAFWIFVLVDCVRTPSTVVKSLPKWAWLVLMIVFPLVGSVLWLVFGKDRAALAGPRAGRRRGPLAPDDDLSFLSSLDRQKREDERIADLERRLAELDDEPQRTDDGDGDDEQDTAGGPRQDA